MDQTIMRILQMFKIHLILKPVSACLKFSDLFEIDEIFITNNFKNC